MKTLIRILASASISIAGASAQWETNSYTLRGGWSAIYLQGEATHATMEDLMAARPEVLEVWRWMPNPQQTGFTASPQQPSPGTPEWLTWIRGGVSNTLTAMAGQAAYLVKCSGNASNTYPLTIAQRPVLPANQWIRNGANFLGFPSGLNGTFPTFANYFTSFPAAVAPGTKIYKYTGGELSSSNPMQLFSNAQERVDRNQAYWFDTEVVNDFYGPLQVTWSQSAGLDFGNSGSIISAQLTNRTTSSLTITLTPVASAAPPSGQEAVAGNVPLTRRTFDPGTAEWVETAMSGPITEVIPAQSTKQISFGIARGTMSGATGTLYASILKITDGGNLMDLRVPARARKTSLAGLWIGDATVTAVESKPQADAVTATGRGYPLRYILHIGEDSTARILSQVFIGALAAPPYDLGLCTREAGLKADRKGEATRIVSVHLPLDRVLGGGGFTVPGAMVRTVTIPFDDPTNPFVHQYHPDHDNKDAKGRPMTEGVESYTIVRNLTFNFTATPPAGSTVTSGWGSSVIGGTYAESVQGLHKDSVGNPGGNGLQISGTFELRRASDISTLTITP